jgi:hypothetical protein
MRGQSQRNLDQTYSMGSAEVPLSSSFSRDTNVIYIST